MVKVLSPRPSALGPKRRGSRQYKSGINARPRRFNGGVPVVFISVTSASLLHAEGVSRVYIQDAEGQARTLKHALSRCRNDGFCECGGPAAPGSAQAGPGAADPHHKAAGRQEESQPSEEVVLGEDDAAEEQRGLRRGGG